MFIIPWNDVKKVVENQGIVLVQVLLEVSILMDVTAVILYKGALACYTVAEQGSKGFVAHLLTYNGDPASSPPSDVQLEKQGRHFVGSTKEEELMEDLFYAAREGLHKSG